MNDVNDIKEPFDDISVIFGRCAGYLSEESKSYYIWPIVIGLSSSIMSIVLPNTLSILFFGLLMVLWGAVIRPRFFSASSENFFLYSLPRLFMSDSAKINYSCRFIGRFCASLLEDKESCYQFLDGRFKHAHNYLTVAFLMKYPPKVLAKKAEESSFFEQIISSIIVTNTLLALVESGGDEDKFRFSEKYSSRLRALLMISEVKRLRVVSVLEDAYPNLFEGK